MLYNDIDDAIVRAYKLQLAHHMMSNIYICKSNSNIDKDICRTLPHSNRRMCGAGDFIGSIELNFQDILKFPIPQQLTFTYKHNQLKPEDLSKLDINIQFPFFLNVYTETKFNRCLHLSKTTINDIIQIYKGHSSKFEDLYKWLDEITYNRKPSPIAIINKIPDKNKCNILVDDTNFVKIESTYDIHMFVKFLTAHFDYAYETLRAAEETSCTWDFSSQTDETFQLADDWYDVTKYAKLMSDCIFKNAIINAHPPIPLMIGDIIWKRGMSPEEICIKYDLENTITD